MWGTRLAGHSSMLGQRISHKPIWTLQIVLSIASKDLVTIGERRDDTLFGNRQASDDYREPHRIFYTRAVSQRRGQAGVEGIAGARRVYRPHGDRRNEDGRRCSHSPRAFRARGQDNLLDTH